MYIQQFSITEYNKLFSLMAKHIFTMNLSKHSVMNAITYFR